ncbi:PAS domain-containing response regulator [Halobacterium litoreum]|uniref:PAS domain S-box protein n=1 Tax=Halobacterium litoreum TaxID=2039234 RepID=A0ABD5NA00_9EURY|nr:PAS domain S-box protein [Halobacterium litoreum]UHH12073.1 PAS domain S-box protein [Halobacterium litoreum]
MNFRGRGGSDDGRIRVLHVDDEPGFADLAATFLEREDDAFEVETATSVSDGLDALDDRDVDCVVSDYDMPGRNGIEFLEAVREDHPDLPFVLFTGKGSEEIASDAISAGVTDYLQKGPATEQYAILANRIRNVVDRVRSRRALDERNRRLETLIQNLPGMVYRCRNEPEWPMEFVGGECEALTGYAASALETGDVAWGSDVLHPDDDERVWDAVQSALDAGDPFEVTYRIRTRSGDERVVWERGRGIYADDDLEALEGFITDVTEREHRKRQLERKNARLEALFENSPDMINVHDEEGVIVDANRRFCEELGYDEETVVGMAVWDVDVNATPEDVRAMDAETTTGDLRRIVSEFQRSDGSEFPVEAHLTQLDIDGDDRYLAISRDISERNDE